MKICPFMTGEYRGTTANCVEDRCALWNKNQQMCGLRRT